MLIDSIFHVPCVLLAEEKQEIFSIEADLPVKTRQLVGYSQERSLEATVEAVGNPDSVYFEHGATLIKNKHSLAPNEIIVEVMAAGLNFIDLLTVLGSLAWSPSGLEGVGIVKQVGSAGSTTRSKRPA